MFLHRKGTNLKEKSEIRIFFLGYSSQSKGYRIYNLESKQFVISRDVEFDEKDSWNWDEKKMISKSVHIPKIREFQSLTFENQDEIREEDEDMTVTTSLLPKSENNLNEMSSTERSSSESIFT